MCLHYAASKPPAREYFFANIEENATGADAKKLTTECHYLQIYGQLAEYDLMNAGSALTAAREAIFDVLLSVLRHWKARQTSILLMRI